jgi:EmrB/QacA subfamily drug resistance transporter
MKHVHVLHDAPSSAPLSVSARGALASLCLCALLAALGTSSVNIALPSLMPAFGASFQQVQWVAIAYLLAITALIVSVGRLGDILGRRRLLLAGVVLFTAGSGLSGLAPTLSLLIAARAGQGLGAAIMMALALALIGDTVPKGRTGSAMGLLGTMSAVGTALGPSAGGMLIDSLGWRAIFLINVPLGSLALLLVWRYLPRDRRLAAALAFDYPGTLLLAIALAAYALAMTIGRGSLGPANVALLCVAVLAAGMFVLAERRSAAPMITPGLFADRVLRTSLIMSTLVSTVMMATLVVGPFYLSRAFGMSAASVGLVLSVGPIAAALAGLPAGRLVDTFGGRRMVLAGLGGIACACIGLAFVPARFGVAGYLGCIVVMTVNFSLFQTANNTAVMADLAPDQRGLLSGMLNLSRNVGFITGASAMPALFALGTGTRELMAAAPLAVATGMHLTFLVAAGLVVFALLIGATAAMPKGHA